MRSLQSFFAFNRYLSRGIEKKLPVQFASHLHTVYKYQVANTINSRPPGQIVLDIGGGKECPFLQYLDNPTSHVIVAVDYAENELRANGQINAKIVADAAGTNLPFHDSSVDVVVSRSVMEHIHDNSAFFGNCSRVLKPGGVIIQTFACKYAPFAVLNQLLPNWLTRRLLSTLHPAWANDCGFRAFYDRCYSSAIVNLLERHGFSKIEARHRYYQSIYFDFFFPFYLSMLIYDLIVWLLKAENLACGLLVTASYERQCNPSAEQKIKRSVTARAATTENEATSIPSIPA